MTSSAPLHTLGELLDRLEAAGKGSPGHSAAGGGAGECADTDTDEGKDNADKDKDKGRDAVTLGALIDEIGTRSFGPLLLLAGLVTVMPVVGDIPGVPTVMALLVLLVAGQLLVGRDHFWLPRWVLARRMRRDRLLRALGWLRRPARWVDRLLRPRLAWLVRGPGQYAIAVACVVIALAMPPMEFVPFSANAAGAVLLAFGLALIARDGVFALVAYAVTALTLAWVVQGLL